MVPVLAPVRATLEMGMDETTPSNRASPEPFFFLSLLVLFPVPGAFSSALRGTGGPQESIPLPAASQPGPLGYYESLLSTRTPLLQLVDARFRAQSW